MLEGLICRFKFAQESGVILREQTQVADTVFQVGNALNSHAEGADEEEVKTDIDESGNDEENEGHDGISDGTHKGGGDVIAHCNGHSCEDDADIAAGGGEDIVADVYEAKEGVEEDEAKNGKHGGGSEAEGKRSGDGLLDLFLILCAEEAGCYEAKAGGEAVEEADDGAVEGGGRADGGVGLLAQELADDAGIGEVIELLEEVSEEEGDGEPDNYLHR